MKIKIRKKIMAVNYQVRHDRLILLFRVLEEWEILRKNWKNSTYEIFTKIDSNMYRDREGKKKKRLHPRSHSIWISRTQWDTRLVRSLAGSFFGKYVTCTLITGILFKWATTLQHVVEPFVREALHFYRETISPWITRRSNEPSLFVTFFYGNLRATPLSMRITIVTLATEEFLLDLFLFTIVRYCGAKCSKCDEI